MIKNLQYEFRVRTNLLIFSLILVANFEMILQGLTFHLKIPQTTMNLNKLVELVGSEIVISLEVELM